MNNSVFRNQTYRCHTSYSLTCSSSPQAEQTTTLFEPRGHSHCHFPPRIQRLWF